MHELIGILGGTFDPIHNGHVYCLNQLQQDCYFNKRIIVPCKKPVLKSKASVSAEQRIAMIEAATKKLENVIIDPQEIKRDTPSYTVLTLQQLKQQYPESSLAFIVGMDAFIDLPKWHQWQTLFDYCHFIVVNRQGFQAQFSPELEREILPRLVTSPAQCKQTQSGNIYFHTITPLNISSTTLRERLANGREIRQFVPPEVDDYIQQHHLYQG